MRSLVFIDSGRILGRNLVLYTKHTSIVSISQNGNLVVVGSARVAGAANQSNDVVGHFLRLVLCLLGRRGGRPIF